MYRAATTKSPRCTARLNPTIVPRGVSRPSGSVGSGAVGGGGVVGAPPRWANNGRANASATTIARIHTQLTRRAVVTPCSSPVFGTVAPRYVAEYAQSRRNVRANRSDNSIGAGASRMDEHEMCPGNGPAPQAHCSTPNFQLPKANDGW